MCYISNHRLYRQPLVGIQSWRRRQRFPMATLLGLHRWLEEQPLRDRESLARLARMGWFLGPDMPVAAILRLGNAVEFTPSEVDIVFGQYIRRHLDDIESRLTGSYPDRTDLFREAFGAHRDCRYSLSIRAFLCEGDGIFHKKFRTSLFRRGRTDAVSAFSSEVMGRFFQAVLHPFEEDVDLWTDTDKLDDAFDGLNRHQVIHGTKKDYNTELNSLKAISLLDNLVWVLNRPAYLC